MGRVPPRNHPLLFPLALGLFLNATWLAYAAGLHGGFLFDDFANLPVLGAGGPVDHWPTFWRYITSGIADPTGRPLTLLSFLLDARDWPADPFPFKRTNLILHLCNGVLLAWMLLCLGKASFPDSDQRSINLAAAFGAAFWMLHPLFVSTTLYIVQREAMLPATFTLLGLLFWLRGRSGIQQGHTLHGLLWMTLGLGGCTLLAVLSKANGVLLPPLALVIEYTLLRTFTARQSSARRGTNSGVYRWAMRVLAWLPTTLVAGYLLLQGWIGLFHSVSAIRPWTLGQRLLTQPRVLLEYLHLLWLPRPFTPGLFNDQVQASASLWSPVSTLPSLLAVLGLIAGAWLLRQRWPTMALAILFYFVGQSLESSTVPLELYFEHRNYLPAMLMFWPLALWLCGVRLPTCQHVSRELPKTMGLASSMVEEEPSSTVALVTIESAPSDAWSKPKLALAVVLLLGLGLMTHARANLWGNTHDQALLWAVLNPDSPRAQANAAEVEMGAGQAARAVARLQPLLAHAPSEVQLALNLLGAQCQLGLIDPATIAAARTALHTTRDPGTLLVNWFARMMGQTAEPPCPQLTLDMLNSLLDAGLTNPRLVAVPGRHQDLLYLQGRLALMRGDADAALVDFNHALDLQVRAAAALEQAALLGSSGFPRLGLDHLDHYEAERNATDQPGFGMPHIHSWILRRQQYWPMELARLRATLRQDAAHPTTRTE